MANFPKPSRRNLPPPPTADEAPTNLQAPEVAPVDGRSARATGRTYAMGTKVRPEFYDELRAYAAKHRLKLVEVLEQGHDALKASKKNSS